MKKPRSMSRPETATARPTPVNQPPPPDPREAISILRRTMYDFCHRLPVEAHQRGYYDVPPESEFGQRRFTVANGTYRFHGGTWLYLIETGRFVRAELAVPPTFGGDNVIQVADA